MKYIDTDLIAQTMEDWKKWKDIPNACSLDFAVIRIKSNIEKEFKPTYQPSHFSVSKSSNELYNQNNKFETEEYIYKTILIEGNLPYALGCYGYFSIDYIKLISAYIAQVSKVEDELHF